MKSNAETVVSQLHSQLSERDAKIDEMRQSRQTLSDYVLKTNEIAKRIELMRKMSDKKKITSAASLALSPQEINDLIESFNFSYDKMPDRLREADASLTDADIFLCCLVKMKVTNQDMAFLLNVSESALKKRKYRLLHEKLARFNAPSLESLLDNF